MRTIKAYFNICTLFVILWGLYGFHWYDIMKDSILNSLSIVFLGSNLLISFWCVFQMRRWKKPAFFKAINILLLLFTIYGLYDLAFVDSYQINGEEVSKASFFISIYRSFLPIYAFYYFAKIGKLNEHTIKGYFFLLVLFYILYNQLFSVYMFTEGGYTDGFTNNLGYIFLALIPYVYIFDKKTFVQYGILLLSMGLIFLSMKRGALAIGLIISGWFIYNELKVSSTHKKIFIIALSCIVIVYGISYGIQYIETNSFAQARLEQTLEGNSSGRNDIYSSLWHIYSNDYNFIELLLGNGPNAPARLTNHDAHNDWLEILLCQGLLGIIFYLVYWLKLIRYWRTIPSYRNTFFIIGTFIITQFLRSLISMSYAAMPTAAVMLLGYAICINDNSKFKYINSNE